MFTGIYLQTYKNIIMKKLKFSLIGLVSILAISCSNELIDVESPQLEVKTKALGVEPILLEDSILNFADNNALENALSDIENTVNSLQKEGFKSMYNVFDEAMGDADNYYDTKEHYEQFKVKYASLYFPEYGDDYSAYLPISDQKLAKLANKNGFLKVNGELIDCKDISSYVKLDSLGLTPPNEKLRSTDVFNYREGKNKLWVKYSVLGTISGKPDYSAGVKFEVCFRKKGFLGAWYNRKASTTIACANCDIVYASNPLIGKNIGTFARKSKNDSFSSHDYEFYPKDLVGGGMGGFTLMVTYGPWPGKTLEFVVTK